MTRHFLQLYLLIVITLAAVSWGQERLWQVYGQQSAADAAEETRSQAALLEVVEDQMRNLGEEQRAPFIHSLVARTGVDLELFDAREIAGADTLASLARGEMAFMSGANGQTWMLRRLDDSGVLAFRYTVNEPRRGVLEWSLTFVFYGAIALVIMMWLWPLTRDLRQLERATSTFGNRNWVFDANIKPRSQVHPLAQAFQRMAARIDGLIRSHQDLSNAMSHEIKTPLARMRFEIEMARTASDRAAFVRHLGNFNTDIAQLNAFVTATLDYAILERAEVALNLALHDFTLIVPAVTESVRRSARPDLHIRCNVDEKATAVSCDAHLMETVLRNLLYNAIRYARSEVRVTFGTQVDGWQLRVDDDGPGIPEADRQRVFGSFVRLGEPAGTATGEKTGFGLGLAIVKRMVEWHGGKVFVTASSLGGAGFCVQWPAQTAFDLPSV